MTHSSGVLQRCQLVFRLSLVSLLYLSYFAYPGIIFVLVSLFRLHRKIAIDRLTYWGLVSVSGLLILSAIFADYRLEAFLQLINFLPFFLLLGLIPLIFKSLEELEKLAVYLVVGAIPINLYALLQYLLKTALDMRLLPKALRQSWVGDWVRSLPHQNRAMSVFDHPNVLASYLVVIFGLGLGLILKRSLQNHPISGQRTHPSQPWTRLVYGAMLLNLLGLFSAGSRNGMFIAIVQLLLFSLFILYLQANRKILISSIFIVGFVAIGTVFVGIGGRLLSLEEMAIDPRFDVWRVAGELLWQRPWLGWGLGSFKLLYPALENSPEDTVILHTHNFWLLLSTEAGLLTAILLTGVVGRICFQGIRSLLSSAFKPSEKPILIGYLLAFSGCTLFALFDTTFYDARVNILNWVVLSGIYAASPLFQAIEPSVDCPNADFPNSADS